MTDAKGVAESKGKYDDDFIRSVMSIGKKALKLLYRLNTDEITLDEFVEGLTSLNATDMLAKYWEYDEGEATP